MNFLLFTLIILTQCAWGPYAGWQQNPAIPGSVATTNITLTSSQVGTVVVFNNSTGVAASGTQFTLPAAVVGMQFTIIADVAKWIFIAPNGTDLISIASFLSGKRISNVGTALAGDSITLVCQTAGTWSIQNKVGTWATTA